MGEKRIAESGSSAVSWGWTTEPDGRTWERGNCVSTRFVFVFVLVDFWSYFWWTVTYDFLLPYFDTQYHHRSIEFSDVLLFVNRHVIQSLSSWPYFPLFYLSWVHSTSLSAGMATKRDRKTAFPFIKPKGSIKKDVQQYRWVTDESQCFTQRSRGDANPLSGPTRGEENGLVLSVTTVALRD